MGVPARVRRTLRDGEGRHRRRAQAGGRRHRLRHDARGCSVYEDRPTACRYYPVALLSMRRQGEAFGRQSYAIVSEPHCLGHAEGVVRSIDEYRAEQGVVPFDEAARGWQR
ncbi:MAG: hypothetical protein U1F49_14495 [Rubrivivax sp.]